MMDAGRTLAEMYPDRFILGIGISHGPSGGQPDDSNDVG